MYERMLNKEISPSENEIKEYVGKDIYQLLNYFETKLGTLYDFSKELKFPFGNNYGWGYKYSCKPKHLCYLFFEKQSFTVLLQINGKGKEVLENNLANFLTKTIELWEERYPCGEGGWVNYRPFSVDEVEDIIKLLQIKVRPKQHEMINSAHLP